MNPKIAIVVLVLLAVLLLCGVGASFGGSDDDRASTDTPWVSGLGGLLAKGQALKPEDITTAAPSSCLQGDIFIVQAGGACFYAIREVSGLLPAGARRMSLRLIQGSEATIVLEQEGALTAEETLSGGDRERGLDVYKDGATMEIRCAGTGEDCQISFR